MKEESNTQTVRSYLNELLDTIDAKLREPYSDVLKDKVEMVFCRTCRARFGEPMPIGFAPPEEAAKTLMRKAAGTKKSIPSAEIWRTQSDLKLRLREVYEGFVREVIGKHRTTTLEITLVQGATKETIEMAMFWWQMTSDPVVAERMSELLMPTATPEGYEDFRKQFVLKCVSRGAKTPQEALKVLEEQAKAYVERHYH